MNDHYSTSLNNRKINLHGKHLEIVRRFVSTIDLAARYTWMIHIQQDPIVKLITTLHSAHLGTDEALDIVAHECLDFLEACDVKSGMLSVTENNSHHEALVARLKNVIESLPKTYIVRIEIPELPAIWPNRIRIADGIDLVTGTVMPLPASSQLQEPASQKRVSFWEFRVSGYANNRIQSEGFFSCIAKTKCIAFRLVSSGLFFVTARKMEFSATILDELTGQTIEFPLTHATKFCLGTIAPRHERLFAYEGGFELPGMISAPEPIDGELEKASLDQNLRPVVRFFEGSFLPDFVTICAAIEWYEDSRAAENQTFAYLAACIGLEAVLGSEETMSGLSKRLADRYAFLLGRGREEREKLADEYTKVLNVRGKLVHAKAARLSEQEVTQLWTARRMLKQVIEHEINEIGLV